MGNQIGELILVLLQLFTFALVGRALLSWFDPYARWPISRVLHQVTEPFVAPIRAVVPRTGMIDLSFIVAFILLMLLRQLLSTALNS
jgi:YggT family protein